MGAAAGGGTTRNGGGAAPAAAAAADSARPPGGGGSAAAPAAPLPVAVADAAHSARRRSRRVRGAAARERRAGRVDLCAAVRALLAATGRGLWRVPRHAAVRVARACLPRATRGVVVADTDGGRPPPAAYGVNCAGAKTADRAAADAYAASLGGLAARVRAATHTRRVYRAPPPAGAVYTLSRGRSHEACGNGMTARAVAAHRAAAVERIAQLRHAAGVQTPEQVTEHASICVCDSEAVRVASRAWLVARRRPLYDNLWGAAGTRGRREARLNAVLQRGRFAAQVARELTRGGQGNTHARYILDYYPDTSLFLEDHDYLYHDLVQRVRLCLYSQPSQYSIIIESSENEGIRLYQNQKQRKGARRHAAAPFPRLRHLSVSGS